MIPHLVGRPVHETRKPRASGDDPISDYGMQVYAS